MAKATETLIDALRNTSLNIEKSSLYQWGHMGACNCGFLAQEVTKLTKAEIHRMALQSYGDWSEHLNDYCPISGLPFDDVISQLIDFGFDADDLKHLEKLSDPKILNTLPPDGRNLCYNLKQDVIKYLHAWMTLLEDEFLSTISIRLPEPTENLMEA